MTKGEKLIWELFLMVRELMPASPDNTRRQTEWAAVFHEMEHPEPVVLREPPAPIERPDPSQGAEPEPEPDVKPKRKKQ